MRASAPAALFWLTPPHSSFLLADEESLRGDSSPAVASCKVILCSSLHPTSAPSCLQPPSLRACFQASRPWPPASDRKSTRLNSSHLVISYAVFCLKKKQPSISATSAWHSRPTSAAGTISSLLRFSPTPLADRKSTRLNSSHLVISYAVFCLKKKQI